VDEAGDDVAQTKGVGLHQDHQQTHPLPRPCAGHNKKQMLTTNKGALYKAICSGQKQGCTVEGCTPRG
jgi:hypothetical protein